MIFEQILKTIMKSSWSIIEELWEGIVFILILILLFNFATNYDDDCLERIAESECEEYDMVLLNTYKTSFSCGDNERVSSGTDYSFLDEEMESCIMEDSR